MWQLPNGSNVPLGNRPMGVFIDAVDDELFISGIATNTAVLLNRGPDHFSPDGEHCCVRIAGGTTPSRCLTFSEC